MGEFGWCCTWHYPLYMELSVVIMVSIRSGEMMLVANLLYFFRFQIGYFVYGLFVLYKFVLSPVIYMILITVSVHNKDHTVRHRLVIEAPLGFVSFVYCWVTCGLLSGFLFLSSAIDILGSTEHPCCIYPICVSQSDALYIRFYHFMQRVFRRVSLLILCNYMQSESGEMTRDPKLLSRQGQCHDVLNLILFGVPKKKLLFQDDDGTIFHSLLDHCQ
eukprot:698266_1